MNASPARHDHLGASSSATWISAIPACRVFTGAERAESPNSAMTTRVVTKRRKMTTLLAKKTTFDDLTLAKSLISLGRNKRAQNVVIYHHLSSFLSGTH
jgi:hypothetical protein